MNKWTKSTLLATALAFGLAGGTAAAEEQSVEIQLYIGNSHILINGEMMTVEEPYLTPGNVTLVPLRVITTAFGANMQWDQATQTVELTYGEKTLTLQIGNRTVTVNGQPVELEAAPENKLGVTMVPIRFITENFGATIQFDGTEDKITIRKGTAGLEGTIVDSVKEDADYERIGDSRFDWSLDYRSDLALDYQAEDGTYVDFADADGDILVTVIVEPNQPQLSGQGLTRALSEWAFGTVLNQSYNEEGQYAELLTRYEGNSYSLTRLYAANGHHYLVMLECGSDVYSDKQQWDSLIAYLESFEPEFDAADDAYKDLHERMQTLDMSDYGVTLDIPSDWTEDYGSTPNMPSYSSSDMTRMIQVMVTSLEPGDTLDAWAKRIEGYYDLMYAEGYIEVGYAERIDLNGTEALARTNVYKRTKTGNVEYEVMAIDGDYKYYVSIIVPEDMSEEEREELFAELTSSIEIDGDGMHEEIGYLYDQWDQTNYERTVEYASPQGGYRIEVPEHWSASANEDARHFFQFEGGVFLIESYEDTTVSAEKSALLADFEEEKKLYPDMKYTTATVPMFGTSVEKVTVTGNFDDAMATTEVYIFAKNGKVYAVIHVINDSNRSPFVLGQVGDALESITFE